MRIPPLALSESQRLYREAQEVVPGGVTGIRRPLNFVPGEFPVYLARGRGGRVIDVDGNEYIDLLCSYGPIILGHREVEVDEAVVRRMADGFCFDLAQPVQTELARTLRRLVPCAEQSFFLKTGSDATTAAVRIARGYTGRTKVVRCGYHGWHDWCVEVKGGVDPKTYADTLEIHFNDLEAAEDLFREHGDAIAAVITTPIGHALGEPVEEPRAGFLEGLRDLTRRHGALLVFDEIRTGFRLSLGGGQARYGVRPDLAVFGKAMANGYPISAVSGRRDVLSVIADGKVFVSSTFFPNSLEMVAALKTIEILERERALDAIWARGEKLLDGLRAVVARWDGAVRLSGIGPMPFLTFPKEARADYKERRTRFYTGAIRRGLFIPPYHHYYICWRHTDDELGRVVDIVRDALEDAFA